MMFFFLIPVEHKYLETAEPDTYQLYASGNNLS